MKRINVVELYVVKRIEKLEQENGSYKLDVLNKTRTVRCAKTLTKINGFDVDKLIKQTTSYL